METDVMTVHELCDYLQDLEALFIDCFGVMRFQHLESVQTGVSPDLRIDEWCAEQQKPMGFL